MRRSTALHSVIDRFGIRPTYVIDYPVATKPEAFEVIRGLVESGRAQVGAHLHPWVTPPFTEDGERREQLRVQSRAALEEAKLRNLADAIEKHVGIRPRSYKAGRYGLGRSTVRILQRLGFDIDISINPLMDYRAGIGPELRGVRRAAVLLRRASDACSRCRARSASPGSPGASGCRCTAHPAAACCGSCGRPAS